jgi:hypothetical protein
VSAQDPALLAKRTQLRDAAIAIASLTSIDTVSPTEVTLTITSHERSTGAISGNSTQAYSVTVTAESGSWRVTSAAPATLGAEP